jgi:hypothetical protein
MGNELSLWQSVLPSNGVEVLQLADFWSRKAYYISKMFRYQKLIPCRPAIPLKEDEKREE